jgi:NitT/TauT family transport system substrate-binding protein
VPRQIMSSLIGRMGGKRVSRREVLRVLGLAGLGGFVGGGCGKRAAEGASNKIRVGVVGITCEAPIYTAIEKGFFKEEGLEPELVRCDWKNYKDALALGQYDITHHLVMYFLKPIEQGLDVKFSGGIHRGCLRLQVPVNSPIKTVQDLRGKRIAAPGMGTPPFIFANRVLGANGVDAGKEITWLVYPNGELGLALDKGEVDAIADSEPIGSMLVAQGKVRNIADQAADAPYKDEYCCAVIVNGKYAKNSPHKTAAATRALLKAAKWVETNPKAAARISVEAKYLASTVDQNTFAISHLRYVPSVIGAQKAIVSAAEEMKIAGMLNPGTDIGKLSAQAFLPLEGVTDEWLKTLQVETVAGAQVTPKWMKRQYARYDPSDPFCNLCLLPVN